MLGCDDVPGLVSLDISSCPNLKQLYVRNDGLMSLDISNNPLLTTLECYGNYLTSLDVSNNTSLTTLYCCQKEDSNGVNLLTTLYIHDGQVIPYINDENRSEDRIPSTTTVSVLP